MRPRNGENSGHARPAMIDLENILIRKARVNLLQDFCDKLKDYNLQPSPRIVHSQLGLLPPRNALDERDNLWCLLITEQNPDLCKFLKKTLSCESQILARLAEDLRNEVKSLLGGKYETYLNVIERMLQEDSERFHRDLSSWFATIQSGITYNGISPSETRKRFIQGELTEVMNKLARTRVRLNFYRQLDNFYIQPSAGKWMSDLRNWDGDKHTIDRRWNSAKRFPDLDITRFFIVELENLSTDLRHTLQDLQREIMPLVHDDPECHKEMRDIHYQVEERTKEMRRNSEELLQTILNDARTVIDDKQVKEEKLENVRDDVLMYTSKFADNGPDVHRKFEQYNKIAAQEDVGHFAKKGQFGNFRQKKQLRAEMGRQLTNVMIKLARVDVHLNFYRELESQGIEPTPNVYVRDLQDWLGDGKEIAEKFKILKETPNPNNSKFFIEELEKLKTDLQHKSEETRNELEKLYDDNTYYQRRLKTVQDIVQKSEKIKKLQYAKNKIINEASFTLRKKVQKQLTTALKKKAKATVHLNFYKELDKRNLQPTPEICERDLEDWLGDGKEVYEKWKHLKDNSDANITKFFIAELEQLVTHFEQQCEELDTKFAALFVDNTSMKKAMETVNTIVQADTHHVHHAKDMLLLKLGRKSKKPTVSKIGIGNWLKTNFVLSEKYTVETKLERVMEKLAKAEINLKFYKELENQSLELSPDAYELDLEYSLDGKVGIYERWGSARGNPNVDIRTFFIEELEDLIASLRQNSEILEQEYRSLFEEESDFLSKLSDLQDAASRHESDVQEFKDKMLEELIEIQRSSSETDTDVSSGNEKVCSSILWVSLI